MTRTDMPEPVSHQVRVEQAWSRLHGLARLLWSKGLTADRLRDIWHGRVHVACDACDTRLTRDELFVVLDAADGVIPEKARLRRLAQGYCVKSGCDSRFYRVLLEPEDGLDWAALWKELDQSAPADRVTAAKSGDDEEPAASASLWRRPAVRLAVAVAALLLALGLRQWYLHGKVPFVTRGYEAAPSMADTPFGVSPANPPPAPPPTNGFRVRP